MLLVRCKRFEILSMILSLRAHSSHCYVHVEDLSTHDVLSYDVILPFDALVHSVASRSVCRLMDKNLLATLRSTQVNLAKTRARRCLQQTRYGSRLSRDLTVSRKSSTLKLIDVARHCPQAAARLVEETCDPQRHMTQQRKHKMAALALERQQRVLSDLQQRRCQAKVMDTDKPCSARVLPYSHYCLSRILYFASTLTFYPNIVYLLGCLG